MNDLNRALGEIRSIRRQIAQTTEFRGYGPMTLAATSGLAFLAAAAQSFCLPLPANSIHCYVTLWIAVAVLSAAVIAVQTVTRSHRMHSGLADDMLRMAVVQFLPCVGAGALLTVVLMRAAPASSWMLPGLWQIVFSLGVFASCRFLPRPVVAVGAWYLLTGLCCLSLGGTRALSPWGMGISYGVGQLFVAGILYFNAQEQKQEQQDEV